MALDQRDRPVGAWCGVKRVTRIGAADMCSDRTPTTIGVVRVVGEIIGCCKVGLVRIGRHQQRRSARPPADNLRGELFWRTLPARDRMLTGEVPESSNVLPHLAKDQVGPIAAQIT